ncbi:hypothetical protein Bca4012_077135 [Brassica carinata]
MEKRQDKCMERVWVMFLCLIGDQELVVLDWMWSSGKSPADRCAPNRKIKPLKSWNQNSIVVVTTTVL